MAHFKEIRENLHFTLTTAEGVYDTPWKGQLCYACTNKETGVREFEVLFLDVALRQLATLSENLSELAQTQLPPPTQQLQ